MKTRGALLYVALLAATSASAQTLYKCVDAGVTTYAERPCGKQAVPIEDRYAPVAKPAASKPADRLQGIYDQVAIDALQRFTIVARNGGSAMDLCVQAGFVTAALLQAEQADLYRKWLTIRRDKCLDAGIRR